MGESPPRSTPRPRWSRTTGAADLLTLVDGRAFVISDLSGDVRGGVHGLVYDDFRHLSRFVVTIDGNRLTPIASGATSPFDALVVHRLHDANGGELPGLLVRRRRIATGFRDDLELWSTDGRNVSVRLTIEFGADFAHIFDVKAGAGRAAAPMPRQRRRDRTDRSRNVGGHPSALESSAADHRSGRRSGHLGAARRAAGASPHDLGRRTCSRRRGGGPCPTEHHGPGSRRGGPGLGGLAGLGSAGDIDRPSPPKRRGPGAG